MIKIPRKANKSNIIMRILIFAQTKRQRMFKHGHLAIYGGHYEFVMPKWIVFQAAIPMVLKVLAIQDGSLVATSPLRLRSLKLLLAITCHTVRHRRESGKLGTLISRQSHSHY